jgi:hypothetical protein
MLLPLALAASVAGLVFDDANGDGRQGSAERGLPGIRVSDGRAIATTGPDGRYRIDAPAGLVFVIVPGDRKATTPWYAPPAASCDFGLQSAPVAARWRFAHLSDTHVEPENVARTRRALALAATRKVDFALVTGDLVRDSLRVGEARARALFTLYRDTIAAAAFPVRSSTGNHDVFGIERDKSGVSSDNPAYGKAMFESYLGPRYYSFERGLVHFIALDTIGVDDQRYFGFLDEAQLAWIAKDAAQVPKGTSIVTFGHIPLRNGNVASDPFAQERMAVNGNEALRHVVRNADALDRTLAGRAWTLALQGHFHAAQRLRQWDEGAPRYHTAPNVGRPDPDDPRSGFTVYDVSGADVNDGEPVWLDPAPEGREQ